MLIASTMGQALSNAATTTDYWLLISDYLFKLITS